MDRHTLQQEQLTLEHVRVNAVAIRRYLEGDLARAEQRLATIDGRLEQIAAEMWDADRDCTCTPTIP